MGVLRLNGKAYGGGIDVIELTQAQYNALPESKLSDDILYVISDSVNGSDGYPPLIYSTEEREVGVWRDGKPLYVKTYTANITANTQWIDTGLDSGDLIVKSEGTLEQNNGQILTLASGDTGAGAGINTFIVGVVTPSKWSCLFRTNNNDARGNLTLTLYYTKGSDVAGSGTWNSQGQYAHHYSEDEKVVGTWIDGKPLYQKTLTGTLSTSNVDIDISSLNVEKLMFDSSHSFKISSSSSSIVYLGYYVSSSDRFNAYYNGNDKFIRAQSVGANYVGNFWITIQYTKTTD